MLPWHTSDEDEEDNHRTANPVLCLAANAHTSMQSSDISCSSVMQDSLHSNAAGILAMLNRFCKGLFQSVLVVAAIGPPS